MNVGIVGKRLHLVLAKRRIQVEKDVGHNVHIPSWKDQVSGAESQSITKHEVNVSQKWLEGRAARIEELQAQVKADIYAVDSRAIAQAILSNESHFV